jgi:hypothetical protein
MVFRGRAFVEFKWIDSPGCPQSWGGPLSARQGEHLTRILPSTAFATPQAHHNELQAYELLTLATSVDSCSCNWQLHRLSDKTAVSEVAHRERSFSKITKFWAKSAKVCTKPPRATLSSHPALGHLNIRKCNLTLNLVLSKADFKISLRGTRCGGTPLESQ